MFVDVDPRIPRAFELMTDHLVQQLSLANPTTHPSMQDFLVWQNEVAMQFRLMQRFREALAAAMQEAAKSAATARQNTVRRDTRTPQFAGGPSRV